MKVIPTSKKLAVKIMLLMVLLLCGFSFLINPPKAHAQQNPNYIYPNPDFYSTTNWGGINFYDTWCGGIAEKYMVNSWISEHSNPTNNRTITVPYGTTSVPLDFNYHIFLCHDITSGVCWQYYLFLPCEQGISNRASLAESLDWIDNASASSTAGQAAIGTSPAGQWSDITNEVFFRYWDDTTPVNFSVVSNTPQGFTVDQDITVRLGHRAANRWGSNWYCVGPGNPTSMAFGVVPANCPIGDSYFTIHVDVGPPDPVLSCGSMALNPSSPEAGQNFTATVNVNYTGSTPSRPTHVMTVAVGSLYSNANAAYTTDGSKASFATPTLTRPNDNPITVTWTLSGGRANTVVCQDTIATLQKPYLRVYGGDVLAGSGFGDCKIPDHADILAFNRGDLSGGGAGVQFASQAKNAIDQFVSASMRSPPGQTPNPLNGLSFANNTGDKYGGGFGGGLCATDYFATTTNFTPIGPTIGPITANPGDHLVYKYDGNASQSNNLVINGNITYANPDSRGATNNIPSVYVIVKGDIYINSTVSQLDGVYIAQHRDDGSGGRIFTCTNGAGLVSGPNLGTTCNTKLTINGAFIAEQVRFLRTKGSLNNSPAGTPAVPASPGWTSWQTVAACGLTNADNNNNSPAISTWGTGRLDVFFKDSDNLLKHCYTSNADAANPSWSLETLAGDMAGPPEAVSWGPNRIDVIAVRAGGAVWHRSCSGSCTGGTWTSWESWGGCVAGGPFDPALASWASGRLDSVVIGCLNGAYHGAYAGNVWSGYVNSLGGGFTAGLSAVSWGVNRIDIFGRGGGNIIYWNAWTPTTGFVGWNNVFPAHCASTGPGAASPGMSSGPSGTELDVFILGCGSPPGLWWGKWTNTAGWSAFGLVDGAVGPIVAPGVTSWGTSRYDVVDVNSAHQLIWKTYCSTCTPGSPEVPAIAEAANSTNIAEVFNFSPELWLVSPGLINPSTKYDSIISLPPVL